MKSTRYYFAHGFQIRAGWKWELFQIVALVSLLTSCSDARWQRVLYQPDTRDFANPERGFYIPSSTRASAFQPLDSTYLFALQDTAIQLKGADYSVHVSLIYRGYELDAFKNSPLSDSFLVKLQSDFDLVRKAGLKMILRFAYTNQTHTGNCKDPLGICPPYGDVPLQRMLEHIRQLKPLLQRNADVIATLQEGFIGIWGENYYTDYLGDASDNGPGFIPDSSWQERNMLLQALLDALPVTRMLQVRTPQIKQKYAGGASASVNWPAMGDSMAYTGVPLSRIGFHNDCFLSSPDDYGTYYDYGHSGFHKDTANAALRAYLAAESMYVPVGGETCDDAYSPQNDCSPSGHALQDMESYHVSFLNAAYNNAVNNDWQQGGCMSQIKERLGYRLVLEKLECPSDISMGDSLQLNIDLINQGFAAPYNPRLLQLVLRPDGKGKSYILDIAANPRRWFPGNHHLAFKIAIPSGVKAGKYEMLLRLPDPSPTLRDRPAYCIRLANLDTWEAGTGLNRLHAFLEVHQ